MGGENEEINASQTVESHCFPQHFIESKKKLGFAPAAVVVSRRDHDSSLTLKSLDYNRQMRQNSPAIGKFFMIINMLDVFFSCTCVVILDSYDKIFFVFG